MKTTPSLHIVGRGTITLQLENGKSIHTTAIQVPECHLQPISPIALNDNGYQVKSINRKAIISVTNGPTLHILHLTNLLFILKTTSPRCLSATSSNQITPQNQGRRYNIAF